MTNDQTPTLPDRSVPHQRHQHARRGGRGREHEGNCKSAQIRPVPAPVGGFGRRRHAIMHSMCRSGVGAGRQGHGLHFSRCETTHHTRGDVRKPTVRPDRSGFCANGRAEDQHAPFYVRLRPVSSPINVEPRPTTVLHVDRMVAPNLLFS